MIAWNGWGDGGRKFRTVLWLVVVWMVLVRFCG
jgi:hypothetical protein